MEFNIEYTHDALAMLLGAAQAFIDAGETNRERALLRAAMLLERSAPRELLRGLPNGDLGAEGAPTGPAVMLDGARHFGEVALNSAGSLVVVCGPIG